MNSHLIEVRYLPCTDRKGSRVALVSHRFERDTIREGYQDEGGRTSDQAEKILTTLGYSIVTEGEMKQGGAFFFCVNEFKPLREALAEFKAKPDASYLWTVEFTGREIGAIGIFSRHSVQVIAHDMAKARDKVYKTHEHITRPSYHRGAQVKNPLATGAESAQKGGETK